VACQVNTLDEAARSWALWRARMNEGVASQETPPK
jgi:hypothetical protein